MQNEITEAMERATKEYLQHRGENPYRVLRGGSELWETHIPAMTAAFTAAALTQAAEPVTLAAKGPVDFKRLHTHALAHSFHEMAQTIERLGASPALTESLNKLHALGGDVEDEINRLLRNAKQDAALLASYHELLAKHGLAPSTSDLYTSPPVASPEPEAEDLALSMVDAGMFSDEHEARREIAMAEFMDNRPTPPCDGRAEVVDRVPDHVWAVFLKEYDDEVDLRPREGNEAMYRALHAAIRALTQKDKADE